MKNFTLVKMYKPNGTVLNHEKKLIDQLMFLKIIFSKLAMNFNLDVDSNDLLMKFLGTQTLTGLNSNFRKGFLIIAQLRSI